MAKKDKVILLLLFTLAKIRTFLDTVDEQLAAIEKREGGGGVPAKKERQRVEYADPIMAASVRGGGRMGAKKTRPRLPKGRIGKSVKKKQDAACC